MCAHPFVSHAVRIWLLMKMQRIQWTTEKATRQSFKIEMDALQKLDEDNQASKHGMSRNNFENSNTYAQTW